MLWIGLLLLPFDGYLEAPTTALCSFVDQLDTARRFMLNKVTRQGVLWMQHHHSILWRYHYDPYCRMEALLPSGEEEQANIEALPLWGEAKQ